MKINFQESTKTIRNPEMGYPTFASWQDMKKDGIGSGQNFKSNLEHEERIKNLHGFTNLLYTLTDFTKNGGGADIPITEAAPGATWPPSSTCWPAAGQRPAALCL